MSFSLSGLGGSPFDWQSMVQQLSQAEYQQKIGPLNTQKSNTQSKLDAWSSVGSKLSALKTAADDLKDSTDFDLFKTSMISDSTTITADSLLSATAGTGAGKGRYDVRITSVAKGDHYQSDSQYSSTDTPFSASGTMTITVGATPFTTDDLQGLTLTGIRDKINELNTGETPSGVTASILQVSSDQYKLLLTADETGTTASGGEGQFTVSSTGNALPASLIAGMEASDAVMEVNGTQLTRTTNTITDAIPGVTLNLNKAEPTGTPVHITLDVDRDSSAIQGKVQKFIDSYNDFIDYTNKQMTYNQTTKTTGGALFGDNILKSIKSSLQNVVIGSYSGSDPDDPDASTLSRIGITLDSNNKLSLNSTKFQDALSSDFSKTLSLFNNLGTSMDTKLDNLTDSIDGTVTLEKKTAQSSLTNFDKVIATRQSRIDDMINRMTNQFVAMDSALSQMQSQLSYLSKITG